MAIVRPANGSYDMKPWKIWLTHDYNAGPPMEAVPCRLIEPISITEAKALYAIDFETYKTKWIGLRRYGFTHRNDTFLVPDKPDWSYELYYLIERC